MTNERKIILDAVNYFIKNVRSFEPNTRAFEEKTNLVIPVVKESLSPYVVSIYEERLRNLKRESVQDIIADMYDYLMLSIRSTAGVYLEIDGRQVPIGTYYMSPNRHSKKAIRT